MFQLYQTEQALQLLSPKLALVIERPSGLVSLASPSSLHGIDTPKKSLNVHGILGFLTLNAGEHLFVVTEQARVGAIGKDIVYAVKAYQAIPVFKSTFHLTKTQIQEDAECLTLVKNILDAGTFYYSTTLDLTRSLQKRSQQKSSSAVPLWKQADDRFFWNRYLIGKLIDYSNQIDSRCDEFILPVIQGFIEIQPVLIRGKQLTIALFTRRDRYRLGPRYHSRGIDDKGNVSNFVETEQMVYIQATGEATSHVQIRGSMPYYWRQVINLKYQPQMLIDSHMPSMKSFTLHMNNLISQYGNVIMVNLINKGGYEGPMGDEFVKHVQLLNDSRIKYTHFEFHHECRKMKWHRISLLIDELESDLKQQGFCRIDSGKNVLRLQTSVVRTNCMDCLDRTNVVQSVFARWSLTIQLRELAVIQPNENAESFVYLESLFKNMWADNANEISSKYSGTGALKTDFTRTGKRTMLGVLSDFNNSVTRYILNNFYDGYKQDGLNLLQGEYTVPSTLVIKDLPYLLALCVLMVFLIMIFRPYSLQVSTVLIAFHLALSYQVTQWMLKNGKLFVNNPRFRKEEEMQDVYSPKIRDKEA